MRVFHQRDTVSGIVIVCGICIGWRAGGKIRRRGHGLAVNIDTRLVIHYPHPAYA